MMRNIILIIFLFTSFITFAQDTVSREQVDLIDIFNKKHKPTTGFQRIHKNKITLSVLPDPNSARQDEFFLTPFFACFYLGNIKETKMSQVLFAPYFTLSNKYVFPVSTFVYTWRNRFNLSSDYRYMVYSQKLYPLGNNPPKQEQAILFYHQYRFHQFISAQVVKNFFIGGGIQLDNYYTISEENETADSSDYLKYMQSNPSSANTNGLAIQIMYDSRQNNINSEYGTLVRSSIRFNTSWMKSQQSSNIFYTEVRKFIPLHPVKHHILALWSIYWTTVSGKPYYLDLPSIGWDIYSNSGRGVYRNSLRSNALLYFESEYRTDLTKNGLWGGVVFVNVTSASVYGTQQFREWYPAVGTGLRLKWNKKYGGNIRGDVAFSKNYISFYLGIAENF